MNDTQYFEFFAVSLAYAGNLDDTPETAVLFRDGGWDDQYTIDLYKRLFEWCESRRVDRLLTYNGAWFDGLHLLNWARGIDNSTAHNFTKRTEVLFENHVDVALAAADAYDTALQEGQPVLPDWKAYDLAGITNDSIWYDDYELPDAYLSEIDGNTVQGEHIGETLGNKYVQNVAAGIEHTSVHRELRRLLKEYCLSDVADLIDLYTALGGPQLDDTYRRTADAIA